MPPVLPNSPLELRSRITWLLKFVKVLVRDSHHEDVAQEALLRTVTHQGRAEVIHPRAFLGQVARNIAVDHARRLEARGGALALEELDDASAPWVAPDQETGLLLKQIILGLPPIYRDVFVLNRFVGLTYGEIAERFGITTKAVEYRMSRALALCATALRE